MNPRSLALVLVLVVLAVGLLLRLTAPEPDSSAEPPQTATATADPAATAGPSDANPASTEGVATATATCPTPSATGSGANRAGLLVTFGNGTSQAICVSFDEATITGDRLLERSGLSVITEEFTGLGKALCKISGTDASDGCDFPSQDCFCQNPPDGWVFFVAEGSPPQWAKSNSGISTTSVADGGAQAQVWGSEDVTPPSCYFDDLCL